MCHRRWETNDGQCGPVETEYRRGHHFPSSGRESNHETNDQERDEESDVDASGCEEHIRAEVMFVDVVPLKHRKYRWLDQSRDTLPQQETSDNRSGCQPRGSTEAYACEVEDGFQCLSPIPPAGERNSRLRRE